jgi:hypothetical protein
VRRKQSLIVPRKLATKKIRFTTLISPVKRNLTIFFLFFIVNAVVAQSPVPATIWTKPSEEAKPWTFWYWMHGAVTKEAITADLEAMTQVGLGGTYLMPIKAPLNPPHIPNPVNQLSPEWLEMVRHSFKEAKRLNLQLGMHVSDGFALAGGPWITPELSMQKLVWTKTNIKGGRAFNDTLQQPETLEGYYKDIAIYAYPSPSGTGQTTKSISPKITSSKADSNARLLAVPDNKRTFGCDDQCWVQYEFDQPFTCRSIVIRSRNNYQSNRLIIQTSDDGKNFKTVRRLEPPRHGWQDWDSDYTHAIPATTAKYFRFVYDKEGSEPGAEDLDAAKWKPSLRITGIELSGEAVIDGYEGKNGEVWRISAASTPEQIPAESCVPSNKIIDISSFYKNGKLAWQAPAGEWTILRIGHTSTGHKNETAGGGKGLECDKFNPAAIKLQFDKWFGEVYRQVDAPLVNQVLRYLHVDSWECGSQNWSRNFGEEFKKRRGYDLLPLLPVMAGVPINSAAFSEKVLLDVRTTIAELVNDKFYVTLANLAKEKGVQLSAESVAPTMVGDGMLHYQVADVPMGEFWLRSPTHDKPNDMLDAISGAHIYGKNIVQAESFTQLRMAWDEHPAMLKTLLDRNFALGINRIFYHVFVHNPWMDKKPGMTLDPIGLFFQRDQTWWKQGKAFVDYAKRCQALLQLGKPVTDIAVFTGEDVPRRSILPDRLVSILPGIIGKEKVEQEKKRLKNEGQPMRQLPAGVSGSANIADPENWVDPLNGYAYDSYNKDALMRLTSVKDGRLTLSTGGDYRMLIIPGAHKMSPNKNMLSDEAAARIRQLVKEGAVVMLPNEINLARKIRGNERVQSYKRGYDQLGKGRLIYAPFYSSSFDFYGIEKDFIATEVNNQQAEGLAWTHRKGEDFDIYFISNQKDNARTINLSLRTKGLVPEIWNPVDGSRQDAKEYRMEKGRTALPIYLEKNGSLFIVLQKKMNRRSTKKGSNTSVFKPVQTLTNAWTVKFDTSSGGPLKPFVWNELMDWSKAEDTAIRYYSGTADYTTTFSYRPSKAGEKVWLNLNTVNNLAEVVVNGKPCGVAWTTPYRVDITNAVRKGENDLKISVVNTWANRLIGDQRLPKEKRVTYTAYPFNMNGKPLLPAGLSGPVKLEVEK